MQNSGTEILYLKWTARKAPDRTGLWKEGMSQMSLEIFTSICTLATAIVQLIHVICELHRQQNKKRWRVLFPSSFAGAKVYVVPRHNYLCSTRVEISGYNTGKYFQARALFHVDSMKRQKQKTTAFLSHVLLIWLCVLRCFVWTMVYLSYQWFFASPDTDLTSSVSEAGACCWGFSLKFSFQKYSLTLPKRSHIQLCKRREWTPSYFVLVS